MIDICDDPKCPCYGKPYVDRGWGYPVCQSTRRFSAFYPGSEDKPLPEKWENDVATEEIHAPTT